MVPNAVSFTGLILIIQSCWITTSKAANSTGKECQTAEPLHRHCENKAGCLAYIKDGLLTNQWNKMECNPFRSDSRNRQCSFWCDLLASRSNVSWQENLIRMCLAEFRKFSSFVLSLSGDNIEVVPCRPFRKEVFIFRVLKESFELPGNPVVGHPSENAMVKFFTSVNEIDLEEIGALQNGASLLETVIQEFRDDQQMSKTEYETKADVIFTTFAFEDFCVRYAQEQLNSTFIESYVGKAHRGENHSFVILDVRLKRVLHHNESEFRFYGSKGENFIKIPSANFHNGSVVLGVAYKNLYELLITNYSADTNTTSRVLNTIIMSAVIYPPPKELLENITLVFKNIKAAGKNRQCVFWNFSEDNPEGWSGQGCQTKIITESQTECVCNHLTHFAVLMDFTDSGDSVPGQHKPSEEDDKILTILTHVGMALSLTGVILTIISYLLLTDRHAPLSHIRVSLTTSIGAGHIIFLAGIDATENKGACVTVAALMQYFLMAAFCWMLVEGIYLYLFVVKVYNIADKIKIYHVISWGLPAVIVAISLSIAAGKDGIQSFVNEKYCWISSANNLIWMFVSFVGLIELINLVILGRVIKEMSAMQQVKDNQTEQIRLGIRACVVLVPLLGVTWLFGFLSPSRIAFTYIFVILNSTQGFSIFFFHCLRNSEIRERFKRRMQPIFPFAVSKPLPDKRISEASQSREAATRDADVIDPGVSVEHTSSRN